MGESRVAERGECYFGARGSAITAPGTYGSEHTRRYLSLLRRNSAEIRGYLISPPNIFFVCSRRQVKYLSVSLVQWVLLSVRYNFTRFIIATSFSRNALCLNCPESKSD